MNGSMAISYQEQQYLQRLVADRPASRRFGPVANGLCEKYGLGDLVGNVVYYQPGHWEQAKRLLSNHDLPAQALGSEATRSVAARYGGMSEKFGTRAVHDGEVAIKLLGPCSWDGKAVMLPLQTCLVAKVEALQTIECDVLCLVENWEAFSELHRYAWLDRGDRRVMVLFRGDNLYSPAHARSVLEMRTEPVWAFVDFDPAGLGIASGLPPGRLERVLLPPLGWLGQAANTEVGRRLYDDQAGQWGRTLDGAANPAVSEAWSCLKTWGAGVTQERMLAFPEQPSAGFQSQSA